MQTSYVCLNHLLQMVKTIELKRHRYWLIQKGILCLNHPRIDH